MNAMPSESLAAQRLARLERGRGGSGLGANVVYNLVTTKFGGTIAVDSEPGKGLHYRIRLPVQLAP
jgi:signal transduction histidine kinase